jgi:hypothetical protein
VTTIDTELEAAARDLLERNTRAGSDGDRTYTFAAPSPGHYPFQWLWDSAFHAIVWARWDWRRAADELEGLFRFQQPDGRLPHVVFWDRSRILWWSWHYLESRGLPWVGEPPRWSEQVQPPVISLAVERIADAGADDGYVRRVLPKLVDFHRYLADLRDPDRDGLVSVISQFETGLDFSPAWHALRRPLPTPIAIFARHRLPEVLSKLGRFDLRRVFARDGHQESVLFNVVHGLGLRAVARLARRVDDTETAEWADALADGVTAALVERCWDERTGLFYPLAGRREARRPVRTIESLTPLALPDLPAEHAARLAEGLADPRRFWTRWPVPSVAIDEPHFTRDNRVGGIRLIWRGATSLNTNWLLVQGLRTHGYDELADELAARSRALVERHGFNEFFDPLDGRPVGEHGFGWATLAVDL